MSNKSSLDYTELAGLRIFVSQYQVKYASFCVKHDDNIANKSVDPQAVLLVIQNRIKELENK